MEVKKHFLYMNIRRVTPSMRSAGELGAVLRGVGYGGGAVLAVTQFAGRESIVLLPVVLMVLFAGMMIESITTRMEENTSGAGNNGKSNERVNSLEEEKRSLQSHIDAEMSLDAVEDRYGDDWYGSNSDWYEEAQSDSGSYSE